MMYSLLDTNNVIICALSCIIFVMLNGSRIGLGRVVAIPVERVLRATRKFLLQPVPKFDNIHFQQGMTMVDPFNHRPKAVTAKQPSAMESATPY